MFAFHMSPVAESQSLFRVFLFTGTEPRVQYNLSQHSPDFPAYLANFCLEFPAYPANFCLEFLYSPDFPAYPANFCLEFLSATFPTTFFTDFFANSPDLPAWICVFLRVSHYVFRFPYSVSSLEVQILDEFFGSVFVHACQHTILITF